MRQEGTSQSHLRFPTPSFYDTLLFKVCWKLKPFQNPMSGEPVGSLMTGRRHLHNRIANNVVELQICGDGLQISQIRTRADYELDQKDHMYWLRRSRFTGHRYYTEQGTDSTGTLIHANYLLM